MFEIVVGVSLFIASIYDLKTTEIPDEIPIFLISLGIFLVVFDLILFKDLSKLTNTIIVGLVFSVFCILMYYGGHWGAGDSALLASIAFLYPNFSFLFKYLINLIIFGSFFMVAFSVVFCYLYSKKVFKKFSIEQKKLKYLYISLLLLGLVSFIILKNKFLLIYSIVLTLAIMTINFCIIVEKYGFKKRIRVDKLKVGDVLVSFKRWRGITEKEIEAIKKSGKTFVTIKEGVRFAPAFLIAYLYTILTNEAILFNYLIVW